MEQKRSWAWLNKNIIGLSVSTFFGDFCYEMTSAVLPGFLAQISPVPALTLGIVEALADGISTLFELFSGWLSDRVGKRTIFVVTGASLVAASQLLLFRAQSWLMVLGARTSMWIGWSVRRGARDALLVESSENALVGRTFALHRAMDRMGAICSAAGATLLLLYVQPRAVFLVALIPGIASVLMLAMVRDTPATHAAKPHVAWQGLRGFSARFIGFLGIVTLFGIARFAPTLAVLRAYELYRAR